MRKRGFISATIFVSLLFISSGCGSSDSVAVTGDQVDDALSQQTTETVTGVFIDDPVKGLAFSCSSGTTSTTDSEGKFTCGMGDDVTFSIGAIKLGTLSAQSDIVTPYTLFPDDHDAAIALARVLQSLDVDGERDNGLITLDQTLLAMLPADLDLTDSEAMVLLESSLPDGLISADEAKAHLDKTLAEAGIEVPSSAEETAWYRPDVNTTWQWQLVPGEDGSINTAYDVSIYVVDLFETTKATVKSLHDEGRHVLCYFSAGSYAPTEDNNDTFPEVALGNFLDDDSIEQWLDISDSDLYPLMSTRFDLAVEKGCDGVVPDNVDAASERNRDLTGIDLSYDEQSIYDQWLAEQAHQRGLAIALVNDLDQIVELEPYFDLSLDEECNYFDECDRLAPFIDAGKPVLHVEYDERYVTDEHDYRKRLCAEMAGTDIQTLVLPKALDDSFRFTCE